jgi:hypothetical protein
MDAWTFLPIGYLLTILIEVPVLVLGLAKDHPTGRRLLAGLWLTACTYPVVILVFPQVADPIDQRPAYLLLAETFAPLAECVLFAVGCGACRRDYLAITTANVLSFAAGEVLYWLGT